MAAARRTPRADQVGDLDRGLLGVDDRVDRRGPAQVQVRVVLPGEADAAVHLDVELGAAVRGRDGQRRRDGRGVAELVTAAGPRPGRRPTPRRLASSVATSMLAQWCLTAWKVAIGRPNCSRTFAYSAAFSVHSAATPAASAERTVRATSASSPARAGDHVGRGPVEGDPGRPAVGSRLVGTSAWTPPARARSPRRRRRPPPAARRPDGRRARRRPTRCAAPSRDGHLAAEGDRADPLPSARPGSSRLRSVVGPGGGQHGAGDHRRHERSRRQAPAQLLDHDQRLRQAEAGAAEFFGHVQPEPGRGRRARPRRRAAARSRRRAGCAAAARDWCLVRKSATVCARARWSSVMAIDMDK